MDCAFHFARHTDKSGVNLSLNLPLISHNDRSLAGDLPFIMCVDTEDAATDFNLPFDLDPGFQYTDQIAIERVGDFTPLVLPKSKGHSRLPPGKFQWP